MCSATSSHHTCHPQQNQTTACSTIAVASCSAGSGSAATRQGLHCTGLDEGTHTEQHRCYALTMQMQLLYHGAGCYASGAVAAGAAAVAAGGITALAAWLMQQSASQTCRQRASSSRWGCVFLAVI
jgi:hypothetical protein